jgi:hypothetical protein
MTTSQNRVMLESDGGGNPESAEIQSSQNLPPGGGNIMTNSSILECSLERNFASPIDSIYYFRSPDGQLINLEGSTAKIGTRVIFECKDSKSKTAYRECQPNGDWSTQNNIIICDKWRYWAAVIAAATSAFIIVVLLIYFTCSAYNKRKKRKYIARKDRIREQDEMMMRNENFVRLNFRPLPLSIHPDASAPSENNGATAPDISELDQTSHQLPVNDHRSRE